MTTPPPPPLWFAWCFDCRHLDGASDLHKFHGAPWCDGLWVAFPEGIGPGTEAAALAAKEAAFGTGRRLADLTPGQRQAVDAAARKIPAPPTKTRGLAALVEDAGVDPARHATEGIDTPGCDCGHDGMGSGWHVSCTWERGQRGGGR